MTAFNNKVSNTQCLPALQCHQPHILILYIYASWCNNSKRLLVFIQNRWSVWQKLLISTTIFARNYTATDTG